MSEERKKILEMLAANKITADEAESLLSKIEDRGNGSERARGRRHRRRLHRFGRGSEAANGESADAQATPTPAGSLKYLRVLVDSEGGDNVDIRVPLKLVRTGIRLSTMLPSEANEKLASKGIDLAELSSLGGDDLVESLRDLSVNVDSSEGDTVRIFCE